MAPASNHYFNIGTTVAKPPPSASIAIIDVHKDFNPRKVSVKGDRTIRPLKGWLLVGNVPPQQISITQVPGVPDTTIPYDKLHDTAEPLRQTSSYTRARSELKHPRTTTNKPTTCSTSSVTIVPKHRETPQVLPEQYRIISNNHFVQLLRTRFGAPCVNEPEKRRCNCSAPRGGYFAIQNFESTTAHHN